MAKGREALRKKSSGCATKFATTNICITSRTIPRFQTRLSTG